MPTQPSGSNWMIDIMKEEKKLVEGKLKEISRFLRAQGLAPKERKELEEGKRILEDHLAKVKRFLGL